MALMQSPLAPIHQPLRNSFVIGAGAIANGIAAGAVGFKANTQGESAMAVGVQASALGTIHWLLAIWQSPMVRCHRHRFEGFSTNTNASSLGTNASASGINSMAFGANAERLEPMPLPLARNPC